MNIMSPVYGEKYNICMTLANNSTKGVENIKPFPELKEETADDAVISIAMNSEFATLINIIDII